jgi:hypothetical protein
MRRVKQVSSENQLPDFLCSAFPADPSRANANYFGGIVGRHDIYGDPYHFVHNVIGHDYYCQEENRATLSLEPDSSSRVSPEVHAVFQWAIQDSKSSSDRTAGLEVPLLAQQVDDRGRGPAPGR